MKKGLLDLEKRALEELGRTCDASGLEKFRVSYLGKRGLVTSFLKQLGKAPREERPELGKLANHIKANLTKRFDDLSETLASGKAEHSVYLDVTLPGRELPHGHLHPISLDNMPAALWHPFVLTSLLHG